MYFSDFVCTSPEALGRDHQVVYRNKVGVISLQHGPSRGCARHRQTAGLPTEDKRKMQKRTGLVL